jgi:type I restriction enzyme M protein
MSAITLEADTRVSIDKRLENLGWTFRGKGRNVYLEQPKTQKEKKLLGGKRPDYVLYAKDKGGDERPIMVIEAKRKGERVDAALEQGIQYAKALDAPIVFATDGLFCKSYHTKFDRTPILNGEEVDEFLRETLAIKYLAAWEVNTVSTKVQYDRKELIKIFDEANNMLRGDGLRAGIERFGEFANILFLKLVSENEQIKHDAGRESGFDFACHWNKIKDVSESTRIEYINTSVYPRLNKLYGTDIFTSLTIRSDAILKEIMDKLDPLTLTDVDSDVKGDAFEYFLKESASTKNDLGEYFTPRHIVKTMVKLANPQIGEKVYDPFCGTGGFLIESFRHIWNTMARTETNEKILREQTIYGNEITNTARITKMNMILAGDGHSNIHMRDSLANPIDGTEEYDEVQPNGKTEKKHRGYDVVITNMPYSQRTKHGDLYDLPSNNGDSVCVQHCMKAVNAASENGRIALVVPEGFLFRKDISKTRELLLKNCDLQSVISLPQGVFLPYTGVKTNILYATKVNQKLKASQKRKDFWYFEVKSDGYTLDNHRRKLDGGSDLDKYQEYRKLDRVDDKQECRKLDRIDNKQREEMLNVGFEVIPLNKVKENAFIFVGSRYREAKQVVYNYEPKTIFSLCTNIVGGGTPSTQNKEYWIGNIPWITSADIDDNGKITIRKHINTDGLANSTSNIVPKDNVIVVSRVGLGKVAVNKVDTAISQDLQGLIIDTNQVLPTFFVAMYSKLADIIKNKARGTTIKGVTKEELFNLTIPIPPLELQRQIVNELDSYQRIIDGAKAVVESYKPHFKIDSDWQVVSLGDVCEFEYGYTDVALDKGDVRFVRITDINNECELSNKNAKYVSLTNENRKYLLKHNDILVARIGSYGKTLIFSSDETAIFASYLIRLKLDKRILPKYYWCFAQSEYYWKQAQDLATGGIQPQFNANTIKLIKIPVPSIAEQENIVKQIETEQALVEPSKKLIEVFAQKMQNRINEIWGE